MQRHPLDPKAHEITIRKPFGMTEGYVADCVCGWAGGYCDYEIMAINEGEKHKNNVRTYREIRKNVLRQHGFVKGRH